MEVDRIAKALPITKTPRPALHALNAAVDALGMAVVYLQDDGVDDAPQVLLDRRGRFLHRIQPATHRPGQPACPALGRPGAAAVVPQAHGEFLDGPGTRRLQAAVAQRSEAVLLRARHVGRVGKPVIFTSFEAVLTHGQ